jgi:hypothetical protein
MSPQQMVNVLVGNDLNQPLRVRSSEYLTQLIDQAIREVHGHALARGPSD